jgi:ABC-type iron transport system FetAB permease component
VRRFRQPIALLAVLLMLTLAACAATTQLGKAKEGLLYDKELAQGGMAEAVRAFDAKLISAADFDKVKIAYTAWQKVHNTAVDAISLAQQRQDAGQPWDRSAVESARALALNAMNTFIQLAVQLKLIK